MQRPDPKAKIGILPVRLFTPIDFHRIWFAVFRSTRAARRLMFCKMLNSRPRRPDKVLMPGPTGTLPATPQDVDICNIRLMYYAQTCWQQDAVQ